MKKVHYVIKRTYLPLMVRTLKGYKLFVAE